MSPRVWFAMHLSALIADWTESPSGLSSCVTIKSSWALLVVGRSRFALSAPSCVWGDDQVVGRMTMITGESVNPSVFWGLVAYNPTCLTIRVVGPGQLIR